MLGIDTICIPTGMHTEHNTFTIKKCINLILLILIDELNDYSFTYTAFIELPVLVLSFRLRFPSKTCRYSSNANLCFRFE